MKKWVKIQAEPIDESGLAAVRQVSAGVGAVICFFGIVRAQEGAASIAAIDYEAFEKMALHQFEKIFTEVERRWPVESIRLVHRVGVVPVNEPSLWVELASPHRGEAFAACQFLIDEMKRVVPIWKKPVPR